MGCERRAMGTWMASSKYFRRCKDDAQLERVAACPLCRKVLEPARVRSLLSDLRMAAPIVGDYAFDSGIPGSAYPASAMHPNFILLKTKDELDQTAGGSTCPRRGKRRVSRIRLGAARFQRGICSRGLRVAGACRREPFKCTWLGERACS